MIQGQWHSHDTIRRQLQVYISVPACQWQTLAVPAIENPAGVHALLYKYNSSCSSAHATAAADRHPSHSWWHVVRGGPGGKGNFFFESPACHGTSASGSASGSTWALGCHSLTVAAGGCSGAHWQSALGLRACPAHASALRVAAPPAHACSVMLSVGP